jgi:hypothetical protein
MIAASSIEATYIRRTASCSIASAKVVAPGSPNRIAKTAEVSITINGADPLVVGSVGGAAGAARQCRPPPADRHDLVLEAGKRGPPPLALQAVDHDTSDRLTGARRQLTRQAVGLGIADVQDHADWIQNSNIERVAR